MSSSISSLAGLSQSGSVDLAAMRQQRLQQMYAEMDKDSDSSVSKDEFVAAAEARQAERSGSTSDSNAPSAEDVFDEADTDGDGALSESEFTTYSAKNAPKGGMGRPPAMGGARGAGGMQSGSSVSSTEEEDEEETDATSTEPADTDGDGEVSMEEQMAYIRKQIEKYAQMAAAKSTSSQVTNALA